MADFFTEDEGNRTCKNLTMNNDVINKDHKFMTSTPFETNTSNTIGVKQLNTDLLIDENKNLKDKDKHLSGFYF